MAPYSPAPGTFISTTPHPRADRLLIPPRFPFLAPKTLPIPTMAFVPTEDTPRRASSRIRRFQRRSLVLVLVMCGLVAVVWLKQAAVERVVSETRTGHERAVKRSMMREMPKRNVWVDGISDKRIRRSENRENGKPTVRIGSELSASDSLIPLILSTGLSSITDPHSQFEPIRRSENDHSATPTHSPSGPFSLPPTQPTSILHEPIISLSASFSSTSLLTPTLSLAASAAAVAPSIPTSSIEAQLPTTPSPDDLNQATTDKKAEIERFRATGGGVGVGVQDDAAKQGLSDSERKVRGVKRHGKGWERRRR